MYLRKTLWEILLKLFFLICVLDMKLGLDSSITQLSISRLAAKVPEKKSCHISDRTNKKAGDTFTVSPALPLSVNQFAVHDFHSGLADVIYSAHPKHLICCL